MSVEFAATIWFRVNDIFCRRRQLVSKFNAYIVTPVAWQKISISTYIVAGDNICSRTTICTESTGKNCLQLQYMSSDILGICLMKHTYHVLKIVLVITVVKQGMKQEPLNAS